MSHRLLGRRASVREGILLVVGLGELEEFEPSGDEGMEFAPGAVDLSPGDGNV